MALTLWHNPRCSKSRRAKTLLDEAGIAYDLRLYLKAPPDAAEATGLARRLGLPLADAIRTCEAPYRELGLRDATPEALAQAVADHPILLQRPILDDGKRAVIGRPPEAIRALF